MPFPRLVKDLSPLTLRELSQCLNPEVLVAANWRSLAGHLGFSITNILNFEREKDPTLSVLQEWWTTGREEKTVGHLLDILQRMERYDCKRLLEPYEFTDQQQSRSSPSSGGDQRGIWRRFTDILRYRSFIDPLSINHRQSLERKLRSWRVEVITTDPYADALFKEIDARDRGKYFGELQIVRTPTVNKLIVQESPLSIAEKFKEAAEKIQPEKIFDRNVKQIFIRGIAGVGKTSLAEYLAYMWASGKFFQDLFDYVFLIECRELKESVEGKSPTQYITELITKKCCLERLPVDGDKVLIIIDGLDEYHNLDEAVTGKNGTLGCLLSKDSEFLKGHATLLTGRPHIEHHFLNDEDFGNYTHFEIIGLDVTQVDKLIDLIACNDSGIAKEIKKTIHSSPHMEKLSMIPRYLELICFVISNMRKDQNEIYNMNTLTPLFTWMFTTLWIKHIEKGRGKTRGYYEIFQDPLVSSFLKSLCRCAHELYIGNKIIFSKELFAECFVQDQLNHERICQMIEAFIIKREKEGDELYQFRHLTTMEFFAAAHCFANQIPIVELVKKKYFQVIRFVAGFHGGAAAKETDKDRRIVKLFAQCVEGKSDKDQEQNAELRREEWFRGFMHHMKYAYRNNDILILALKEAYSFKAVHLLNGCRRLHFLDFDLYSINIGRNEDIINLTKFAEELTERNLTSFLNLIGLNVHIKPSSEEAAVNFFRFLPHFRSVSIYKLSLSNEFCEKLLKAFQANKDIRDLRWLWFERCKFEASESTGIFAELLLLIPFVGLDMLDDDCRIVEEVLRKAKSGRDTKLRMLRVDSHKTEDEWKHLNTEISASHIRIDIQSWSGNSIIKNYDDYKII